MKPVSIAAFLSGLFAIILAASPAAIAAAQGQPRTAPPPDTGFCPQVKNPSARQICLTARGEYYMGRYVLSLGLMQKAFAASPKEPVLRLEVARIMMRVEAAAQAERELRQARQEGARDQDTLPLLFAAMMEKHEEVTLLNEFPEPAPSAKGEVPAVILQGRAMALRSSGSLAEAAAAMDRSLSLNRTPGGLLIRADIAAKQKDAVLARKLVDEAYGLAPTNSPVMTAKLEQLVESDDMPGVLALSDRMQKLYPINSTPRECKIRIFLKHNMDAKANAEVSSYMMLRPKSGVMLYYKALLKSRAHDKKGASEIVMTLPGDFVKSHPEFAVQMARIVRDDGHVEAGSAILGKALGAAPDLLEVRLQLVMLRLEQNSPQSAMLLLSPVQDSRDPQVQNLITKVRARIAKDRAF